MELEQRIKDLEQAVQQSVMNHHAILGRLEEAKYLLEQQQEEANKEADKQEEPQK